MFLSLPRSTEAQENRVTPLVDFPFGHGRLDGATGFGAVAAVAEAAVDEMCAELDEVPLDGAACQVDGTEFLLAGTIDQRAPCSRW